MQEALTGPEARRIGWFCSFVPEELILAAGQEPVRLQGMVDKVKESDAYLWANLCPYLKNLLDSGLSGRFTNLAGLVFANSCDGTRRLADLWRHYLPDNQHIYFLEVPRNQDQAAVDYFTAQLSQLKSGLENDFGLEITDDRLKSAICLMNENRRLIAEVFERQKPDPPDYRGSELFSLLSAEATRPKAETAAKLKELVKHPAETRPRLPKGPRIMVIGNGIHRPVLFDMVEKAEGSIVIFDTCNGLKHYDQLVDENRPPLEALARRYLLKASCARMPGFTVRMKRLADLIDEYRVEGVIFSSLKYCDYSLFEAPHVEKLLKDLGRPCLVLENDYVWGDAERQRVRVEAFLEIVKGEMA